MGGDGDNRSIASRSSRDRRSLASSADEDDADRIKWGSQAEFILTLVGYAVGLGNVWRFPYLAFSNGGGAFLIPYFVCLVLVGFPIFYMEVLFGQFASLGPLAAWTVNPLMKGLGVAMVTTNTMIAGYYSVIISWCIYYFFASMGATLPWAECDNWWNTELCRTPDQFANLTAYNISNITIGNETYGRADLQTPSEEYYYNNVLRLSGGLEDLGTIVWQLALTLVVVWVTVFVVLLKGIGSLGKVVYFTSVFPYVVMTIMVIRGCTLDGANVGIDFYLKPDWAKLAEPQVWSDAATQIFYSLSACTGGLMAMASYNDFHNNALRDSIIVPLINCATSFYAGFAIFSVLGFMANQKGVSVQDVAADGPGLVFVVYPEGLQQMPVAPLWAVLFFFMMLMLGFSSVFSMAECLFSAVIDEFEVLQTRKGGIALRAVGCLCFYLFGLMMVTEGGFYLFNIIDTFTGGFPLLFVGLFELIAICYIYGYKKFAYDIELMLGSKPIILFPILWMGIAPGLLLAVIIFLAIMYEPISLDNYEYPDWGQALGWVVVGVCLVGIPLFFFIEYCKLGGGKLLSDSSQPTDEWGPALKKHRKGTNYDRSQPRIGVAYTESSSDPFNKKNGDLGLSGSFKTPDSMMDHPLYQKGAHNSMVGYDNIGYQDRNPYTGLSDVIIQESSAF